MDCYNCVHNYYESDTNYWECTDPEYTEGWEEGNPACPHYYAKEDAKADAKYGHKDKY